MTITKQDHFILAAVLTMCVTLVACTLPDDPVSHTDRPQARPTHWEAL